MHDQYTREHDPEQLARLLVQLRAFLSTPNAARTLAESDRLRREAREALRLAVDHLLDEAGKRRVILHEVRPRLASISDLVSRALEMDGLGQRIALRTIGKLSRECVALVDAWAEGDRRENRCHRDGIAQLRLVCGGLDRGSHE